LLCKRTEMLRDQLSYTPNCGGKYNGSFSTTKDFIARRRLLLGA
jgi:hypothetical protein